jgi:hypothetical protein
MENSNGRLVQCTKEPEAPTSFCFGSSDSGHSNNPHLYRREWFDERLRAIAMEEMENNQWRNNYFEFRAQVEWLTWSPPAKICVSEKGIFRHHEIDQ